MVTGSQGSWQSTRHFTLHQKWPSGATGFCACSGILSITEYWGSSSSSEPRFFSLHDAKFSSSSACGRFITSSDGGVGSTKSRITSSRTHLDFNHNCLLEYCVNAVQAVCDCRKIVEAMRLPSERFSTRRNLKPPISNLLRRRRSRRSKSRFYRF